MATQEQINLVMTREQKYQKRRSPDFYFPREILFSKAFRRLSKTKLPAVYVYMIFRTKLIMKPFVGSKQKRSGKGKYYPENADEIKFTYDQAFNKYGITNGRFQRTIDLLIEVGLIDITKQGSGIQGDYTLYAISERWRLYGTPEFVAKKRPKRKLHYGFTKGNSYGKNAK